MKHFIVTAIALLAIHCVSGDVCQDLANRIDKEYELEEVNACYECGWHKILQDKRHSLESTTDEYTGADMFRVGSPKPVWCGSDTGNDYLEITFHKTSRLGGLVIQGDGIASWTTFFQVSYDAGSGEFNSIRGENGVMVFQGSSNEDGIEERKFPIPVKAISIRIHPVTDHTAPCMRVNVYACNEEDPAPVMMDAYRHTGYERARCTQNVLEDCGGLKCVGKFKRNSFNCEICECEEKKSDGVKFESDIDMTPQTRAAVEESFGIKKELNDPGHVFKSAAFPSSSVKRWFDYQKDGNILIPFTLSDDLSSEGPAAIQTAIDHLAHRTCIRLIPRTKNEQYYIKFKDGTGCSSPLGKQHGGYQPNQVTLARGCLSTGIIVHEILHSLGFWHEQSRPDRDQYVHILEQNYEAGNSDNFQKRSKSEVDSMGSPYDLGSVMHYGSRYFSINGNFTIVTHDGGEIIPQRKGLSAEDTKQVNTMYGCKVPGTSTEQTSTASTTTTTPTPTPTTTTTTTTTTRPSLKCVDQHEHCQYWSGIGECDRVPSYMTKYCKKSCKVCSSREECKDKASICLLLKNYCTSRDITTKKFMEINCQRTCNVC